MTNKILICVKIPMIDDEYYIIFHNMIFLFQPLKQFLTLQD